MRFATRSFTFRAHPDYELIQLERLEPAEQKRLREGYGGGELYGELRPRNGSSLPSQAVSSDTALLVLTLANAGTMPRYVVERLGDDAERTIGRLVLDGVLEVLFEGQFLSGPVAMEVLSREPRSQDTAEAAKGLAVAALQYAQELRGLPQSELTLRLYCYGRQPVSPELSQRFVDAHAVAIYLGLAGDGPVQRVLSTRWTPVLGPAGVHRHWWQWIAPLATREYAIPGGASYKLYVSPSVNDLRDALETIAEALVTARGVTGCKVGAGVTGICRPDKVIVYFAQLEDLRAFALVLKERLAGCSAHGVPFTAAVTPDALLSWGADPPRISVDSERASSWRMWVVERLAEHLASAMSANLTTLEPWQFALERLRLSGIDTHTWIPTNGMWPEAFANG